MCSSISSVLPTDVLEENSYVTAFNYLLETQKHVDVIFVLEGKEGDTEFFAHKLILSMRSPYFEDKFYGSESNEKSHIIRLRKVNPQAFKDMIRYCYGNNPQLKTAEEIYALFKMAEQFKVISLMNLCHTRLINMKIEPRNVFTMLKFSEVTRDKSLIDKCNKVLIENTGEVLAAYELCDVTPSMVHIILDLATLSLDSEYELLKWIFDWAKVKVKERDSDCESAREYLEKLLQDMNFLALTYEDFAKLCNDNQDFFSCEEIASVYLNIVQPGSSEMPDWYDSDLKCRTYTGLMKLEQNKQKESISGHIKEKKSVEHSKCIKTNKPIKLPVFEEQKTVEEKFRECKEDFNRSVENFHRIMEMIHKKDLKLRLYEEISLQLLRNTGNI